MSPMMAMRALSITIVTRKVIDTMKSGDSTLGSACGSCERSTRWSSTYAHGTVEDTHGVIARIGRRDGSHCLLDGQTPWWTKAKLMIALLNRRETIATADTR